MANKFYEDGPFAACQPCFISEDETTAAPNDPLFSAQWALKNTGQNQGTAGIDINYLPAREVTQGSSDIIVAVLDHGTQLDHPDLNVSSKSYDTETGGRQVRFGATTVQHVPESYLPKPTIIWRLRASPRTVPLCRSAIN